MKRSLSNGMNRNPLLASPEFSRGSTTLMDNSLAVAPDSVFPATPFGQHHPLPSEFGEFEWFKSQIPEAFSIQNAAANQSLQFHHEATLPHGLTGDVGVDQTNYDYLENFLQLFLASGTDSSPTQDVTDPPNPDESQISTSTNLPDLETVPLSPEYRCILMDFNAKSNVIGEEFKFQRTDMRIFDGGKRIILAYRVWDRQEVTRIHMRQSKETQFEPRIAHLGSLDFSIEHRNHASGENSLVSVSVGRYSFKYGAWIQDKVLPVYFGKTAKKGKIEGLYFCIAVDNPIRGQDTNLFQSSRIDSFKHMRLEPFGMGKMEPRIRELLLPYQFRLNFHLYTGHIDGDGRAHITENKGTISTNRFQYSLEPLPEAQSQDE